MALQCRWFGGTSKPEENLLCQRPASPREYGLQLCDVHYQGVYMDPKDWTDEMNEEIPKFRRADGSISGGSCPSPERCKESGRKHFLMGNYPLSEPCQPFKDGWEEERLKKQGAEPEGIGAVIRDADGMVAIHEGGHIWVGLYGAGTSWRWDEFEQPVEVLSPGVML